ncbi:MAG: methyltransferase domain-containing protein [Sphingomonadales bacterium]
MATGTKQVRVPLSTRLKVWWEGYDMAEVEARMLAMEKRKALSQPKPDPAPPPPLNEDLPVAPWDNRRIEVAQYIWGDGYCGPGGPEYVIAMSKLLALSPKMSALVLGAGLGGPSRVLAQEFGVWITGVEESEPLANAGMELSVRSGMAKKAPIRHYNPENPVEFERNFDRAFAKEALFTVRNKKALVKQVTQKLKPDSLFLIVDYFLAEPGMALNADLLAWKEKERETPYLVTGDDMVDLLEDSGFVVRVNEDISEQYADMIAKAWAEADKVVTTLLEQGEEGRQLVDVLMHEAEHWFARSRLLQAGVLQARRILGTKKVTKTLSDW